ncbi:2-phospho-L-lactate guanylyltransferase [Gammaproteobacteria bacterium]|nr:MAG: 2-phospho-L-lactate guanylyltransferase [Gammaproteobacteria bacterium]CAG0944458.1 2-phospho-L-lactate guanylyltransferase [Gammaproteobacteria bacterium]
MKATWALLPIRSLEGAKSRLAALLDADERATLARCLAQGVIDAARAARGIDAVAVVTGDTAARALAESAACRWLPDDPALGLSGNVDAAMALLAAEGARTVVVVPADLPLLAPADIEALLAGHGPGVTVVPAATDGGTNALAMTPPGAAPCRFGRDSASRHLQAALERGVAARQVAVPGFARDLDTEDDVRWLCAQPGGGTARQYLEQAGICARLRAGGRRQR